MLLAGISELIGDLDSLDIPVNEGISFIMT